MNNGSQDLAHLQRSPAEKSAGRVLPAAGVTWTAAEVMHMASVHVALPLGGATALTTAVAWGLTGRRNDVPASLPWWIGISGAWLDASAVLGPLHWWPAPVLTIAWAGIALAARRAAYRRKAVTDARQWRAARADWLDRRHRWHFGGSHLLEYEETRLGERYVISTKGTGKRASQFATRGQEEVIAEAEDLPVSRVRVSRHRLAGRVVVSVRRTDPWETPVLHPAVSENPEFAMPYPYSIVTAPQVGIDPETGAPLLIPLWSDTGALNVSITAKKGGGKTTVLDALSERITAAPDALMVRLNLSLKGHAEEDRWGPACHLTAFGPHQVSRAAKVLRAVNGIAEWRSKRYTRTKYVPVPADPLIVVVIDESDAAMTDRAVKNEADAIATKGREYGITLVRAGQRGTVDYRSAKQRSQDDVIVLGKVRTTGELNHAAGNAAYALPDMTSYGEGHPGVWGIVWDGGSARGRAFLMEPWHVGPLAEERAYSQPELHPDCRTFLGEEYEQLLRTEVFARWARRHHGEPEPEEAEDPQDVPVSAAAPEPSAVQAQPVPASAPVAVAEDDSLEHLDWEMNLDKDTRTQLDALDAKLGNVRQSLAETAVMPRPAPAPPEIAEARIAEAWRQAGERAEIPPEHMDRLLGMLREGTTIRRVAEAFGEKQWTARTWLEKLRGQGAAYVDGERKAARWRLTPPPVEE